MTTNVYTFSPNEARMRWEEPYLTEGLNAKAAVVNPAGLLRGFRLAGTATNCELQVAADSTAGDHQAHYRTGTGFGLSLRHIGSLLIDLTAYAGQTVIVALYATYAVGAATTAFVRVYTLAEYAAAAEKAELLVIGRVTVTSGAPITVFDYNGRSVAAFNYTPGAMAALELVRNPGFEGGLVGDTGFYSTHFWEKTIGSGTGSWALVTTPTASGSLKALSLAFTAGPMTGSVAQQINAPVVAGQLLRLSIKYRVDAVTTAGTVVVRYNFLNAAGTSTGTVSLTLATNATTASAFVTVEQTLVVPSGVTHLRTVSLVLTGVTFAAPGTPLYFDDFHVHLCEVAAVSDDPAASASLKQLMGGDVLLEDPTAASPEDSAALLRYRQGTASLTGSDRNGMALALDWLGAIRLGAGMLADPEAPVLSIGRDTTNVYTLAQLWDSDGTTKGRLYLGQGGETLITHNAVWDEGGALWGRDNGAVHSTAFRLTSSAGRGFYQHSSSGTSTWANSFNSATTWTVIDEATLADGLSSGWTMTPGVALPDTAAGAQVPRVYIPRTPSFSRYLVEQMRGGSQDVRVYRYVNAGIEKLEFVFNATWNATSSEWSLEQSAQSAARFTLSNQGLFLETKPSSSAAWADGAWAAQSFGLISDPNPGVGAVYPANTVSAAQIAKAWGVVTTDGSGGFSLVEGVNVDSGDLGIASGSLIVGFSTNMASANYVVQASADLTASNAWKGAQPYSLTSSGFLISVFAESAGVIAQENLASVARTIRFSVFAKQ